MGCTQSKSAEQERGQNKKIEKEQNVAMRKNEDLIKLLLLGAGESGKSTIIKQMRIIHSRGFPEEERHQTRAVIYSNIVIAFKVLLDIMNTEEIDFEHEETKVSSRWAFHLEDVD